MENILDKLYELAQELNIDILFSQAVEQIKESKCFKYMDEFFIILDNRLKLSPTRFREKFAHELGHCYTDNFYTLLIDNIALLRANASYAEQQAENWAIRQLVPIEELTEFLEHNEGTAWNIAEEFGVSAEKAQQALDYYQNSGELKQNWEFVE